ncbi:hypothetical protein SAMN02745150_00564 [Brevinema andersonii]|uniref:Uncharacterized protein n=1 Tax=Brevinema andersonii TaxID=34097 RepID=A0A1I1DJK8_BREAD|nr:hypothetical protein [Brevinema andersonii]SFB74626.1 hypothetical protein SAMN02745150_00564 [Brevinema andersonii]
MVLGLLKIILHFCLMEILVANVSKIIGSSKTTEKYAVEVIEDVSGLQGVYRLHGNGQYGGMYLVVVGLLQK